MLLHTIPQQRVPSLDLTIFASRTRLSPAWVSLSRPSRQIMIRTQETRSVLFAAEIRVAKATLLKYDGARILSIDEQCRSVQVGSPIAQRTKCCYFKQAWSGT